jgi:hypothetical protein
MAQWAVLDQSPTPMLRWQATLSAADPVSDDLPLGLVVRSTVQVDGFLGASVVEVAGSNSGDGFVPMDVVRHADLVPLPEGVAFLRVSLLEPDAEAAVIVTVAGRR